MLVWLSIYTKGKGQDIINLFYDKGFVEFGQPEKTKETEVR